MAHWKRLLPEDAMLEVDYEALVADPEAQGRRILAFCGLEAGAGQLEAHRAERRIRTASALQARRPIHTGAVGRWRRYEPLIGPLLEALELPISASPPSRRKPRRR